MRFHGNGDQYTGKPFPCSISGAGEKSGSSDRRTDQLYGSFGTKTAQRDRAWNGNRNGSGKRVLRGIGGQWGAAADASGRISGRI